MALYLTCVFRFFLIDDDVGGEGVPPGPTQGVEFYIGSGRTFRFAERHEILHKKEEKSYGEKQHLFATGYGPDRVRYFLYTMLVIY